MPPRRRRKSLPIVPVLRVVGAVVAIGALVIALALGAAMLLVDPNGYKSEIADAVKRATGRTLNLRGEMRIAFGLPPWVVAEDVTLANAPGGSRPDMLTLDRVEARIALVPLLWGSVDVIELDLFRPDLLLETDAAGHRNWLMRPNGVVDAPVVTSDYLPPTDAQAPKSVPVIAAQPDNAGISVQAVHISEGRIGWRDGRNGQLATLTIPHLEADASGPNGSLLLSGELASGGRTLKLEGESGSVGRLLDAEGGTPWPVQLIAQGQGFHLTLRGAVLRPLRGDGVSAQLDLVASDLSAIAAFMPPEVPAPHDANISLHVETPDGGGAAAITKIALHVGGLKLPTLLPGIDIGQADFTAPGLDQPVHIDLEGVGAAGPMRLVASFGLFGALLPGSPMPADPMPMEITVEAGGTLVHGKGRISAPGTLSGIDADMFVRIPDLSALGPLAGHTLPPLKQVTMEGHVFGHLGADGTIGLRGFNLTMPEAQFTGDLDFRLGPRPSVHGTISAQQMDLDNLLADVVAASPPVSMAALSTTGLVDPLPATAFPEHATRLISDKPIDLSALGILDLDLNLNAAAVQTGGVSYSNVAGQLVLHEGRLVLDPFTGSTPIGDLSIKFGIDTKQPTQPVALSMRAPIISLAPILIALGQPNAISGALAVDADLRGAGHTPHAIAGSLDGHIGIGLGDGEIDAGALAAALGEVMKAAKLPENVLSGGGRLKLRCLALRSELAKGVATVSTLVVDATRLMVQGSGTVDLGDEALALRLRPLVRVGPGLVVPVRLGGTLLDPRPTIDVGSVLTAPSGGKGGVLGAVAAAIGGERNGVDPCVPGLTAALAGDPQPAAPAAEAPAPPPAKSAGKPPKTAEMSKPVR